MPRQDRSQVQSGGKLFPDLALPPVERIFELECERHLRVLKYAKEQFAPSPVRQMVACTSGHQFAAPAARVASGALATIAIQFARCAKRMWPPISRSRSYMLRRPTPSLTPLEKPMPLSAIIR